MTHTSTEVSVSDMNYVYRCFPDIWKEVWDLFDKDKNKALDIVRIVMQYHEEELL